MEITALDTGRTAEISITDSNGVCYASDLLGNNGCPHNWNDEAARHEIEKDDDLLWWEIYAYNEQLSSDAYEIMMERGWEKIWFDAVSAAGSYDLEFQAGESIASAIAALEDGEVLEGLDRDDVEEAHSSLVELRERLKTFIMEKQSA